MCLPVPDAPGEIEADGVHATITAGPLNAESSVGVVLTLRNDRGAPITLEPYMGELGHPMPQRAGDCSLTYRHPGREPSRCHSAGAARTWRANYLFVSHGRARMGPGDSPWMTVTQRIQAQAFSGHESLHMARDGCEWLLECPS